VNGQFRDDRGPEQMYRQPGFAGESIAEGDAGVRLGGDDLAAVGGERHALNRVPRAEREAEHDALL
jgi:hypothetical protein